MLCTFPFQGGINTVVIIVPSVPKVFKLFAVLSSTGQRHLMSFCSSYWFSTAFLVQIQCPLLPFFSFDVSLATFTLPLSQPVFQASVTLDGGIIALGALCCLFVFLNHPLSSFTFFCSISLFLYFFIFFFSLSWLVFQEIFNFPWTWPL